MSMHINELKPMRLYNSSRRIYLPINDTNTRDGSAVFLLTPNIESSIKTMNLPYVINRKYFESYYLEKDSSFIITQENTLLKTLDDTFYTITEEALSSKDRKAIPDSDFGIPEERKFPLNDENHVLQAIRMFNHVEPSKEKELADRIMKKITAFGMKDVQAGEDNRFIKYFKVVTENLLFDRDNLKINFDKWGKDENHNILFITGFSGAGKTTIADKVKDDDTIIISLDTLYNGHPEQLGEVGEMLLEKIPELKAYARVKGYYGKEAITYQVSTMMYNIMSKIIEYSKEKFPKKKFIVEGIQLYRYIGAEFVYGRPIIVRGTSALHSMIRRLRREDGFTTSDVYDGVFSYLKWYLYDNAKLGQWIKDQQRFSYVECATIPNSEFVEYNYRLPVLIGEDAKISTLGIQSQDRFVMFNEMLDEEVLYEATKSNNGILRKLIYSERIRNNKEIVSIYSKIKESSPWIRYTRLNYGLYKGKNLFIDTSFYNQAFFKNNFYKSDRSINLYFDFINRFLEDKRLEPLGYTRKVVFVPVDDWNLNDFDMWDYKTSTNPISIIYRLVKKGNIVELKEKWSKYEFLFTSSNGFFKVDFKTFDTKDIMRFLQFIKKLSSKEPIVEEPDDTESMKDDTTKAIVTNIVDKIQKTQHIDINYITGKGEDITNKEFAKKVDDYEKEHVKTKLEIETDEKKKDLIERIEKVASVSDSTEDAINNLEEDEYIKKLLTDLAATEDNNIRINNTRSLRMEKLNDEFTKKTFRGVSIKNMLDESKMTDEDKDLPEQDIPINTINEEWHHLKSANFNKEYDVNQDIMAILYSLSEKTVPVSVRDVDVVDATTSEDLIETWTVGLEDSNGQRFTLKFDIPKFINNRFMRLRGNDKIMSNQLMNLPIIKTDSDVCQMTTNYNKIFFRLFGTSAGKSYVISDRILKVFKKYKGTEIETVNGDNSRINMRYHLPIDYIDLGSVYSKIIIKNKTTNTIIHFNQDEIKSLYGKKVVESKGIPYAYDKIKDEVLYYDGTGTLSSNILNILNTSAEFAEMYNATSTSSRYTYSKASILNTEIPVIVIMAYNEGLITAMKKGNVEFEFLDKRGKYDANTEDIIKLSDGVIKYKLTYESSLLMNGLKECATDEYSIKDVNTKAMWVDFLDQFGGRLKADGLDNFYDLMVDPMTVRICKAYKLPYDYCEMMAYCNILLADNKFNKHVDISGNRFRCNEIVAGYAYKCIAKAYADYRNMLKRTSKSTMSMKQSAIIDAIMQDSTFSDASAISELAYAEAANTVSFKGHSGMNSDRSYDLAKRTYDDSMINNIAMATGFAENVGINRQTTINMNIQGKRGYIKTTKNYDNMNDVNTLSITEALTPFGTVSDDPFRSAMTFIQTSKHSMRIAHGDPVLVTNGADEALPYMTPDIFSFKSKGKGKVLEVTDEYMIIQYANGKSEFIDLTEKVYKNSDGGFFITIKLDTDLKVGNTIKDGQIIAFDKLSYTSDIGYDSNPIYNNGILVKTAVIMTEEGYEDSGIISEYLTEAMASEVVVQKPLALPKNANVYNMVKKGQAIQEGEPLIVFQNAFEDEDVNMLLKNLTDDEELVSDLGRIPVKSKITGIVQDIKIYRTVELDEMSDSLKKIVSAYEKNIEKTKKVMEKYDPERAKEYTSNYKLDAVGKLKNARDMVYIEFYLKYNDQMSIGDKLVNYSALKQVIKDVFPKGKEPTSAFRKNEPVDSMLAISGVNKRMVSSIFKVGAINKIMIELDRKCKEINGIKWKNLHD